MEELCLFVNSTTVTDTAVIDHSTIESCIRMWIQSCPQLKVLRLVNVENHNQYGMHQVLASVAYGVENQGLQHLKELYLLERPFSGRSDRHKEFSYDLLNLCNVLSLTKLSVRVPSLNSVSQLNCTADNLDWESSGMDVLKIPRCGKRNSGHVCRLFVRDENYIRIDESWDYIECIQTNRLAPLPFTEIYPQPMSQVNVAFDTLHPVNIASMIHTKISRRQPRQDDWPGHPVYTVSGAELNVRIIEEYVKKMILQVPQFVFTIRHKPDVLLMFQNGLVPLDLSKNAVFDIMEAFANAFIGHFNTVVHQCSFISDDKTVLTLVVHLSVDGIQVHLEKCNGVHVERIKKSLHANLQDFDVTSVRFNLDQIQSAGCGIGNLSACRIFIGLSVIS